MIGHSSSIFASLQVDDFHKRNQISNDFDTVLKKFLTFFTTEMSEDKFVTNLCLILFVGRFGMIGHSSSIFASLQVDEFHKRNQTSNDFDSVLQKVSDFFWDAVLFFRTKRFRTNLLRICI